MELRDESDNRQASLGLTDVSVKKNQTESSKHRPPVLCQWSVSQPVAVIPIAIQAE